MPWTFKIQNLPNGSKLDFNVDSTAPQSFELLKMFSNGTNITAEAFRTLPKQIVSETKSLTQRTVKRDHK